MELDDLKATLQRLGERLDRYESLDRQRELESRLAGVRSTLRRLDARLLLELLCGIVAALLTGFFLAEHWSEWRLAVPAAVLLAASVATIIWPAQQLARIGRIDYSAPVEAIQLQLAHLRAERLRTTRWILLLAPLFWTPLLIVGAKGILNADVMAEFDGPWIAANIAFGLAFIPLAIAVSRRYGDRFDRSPRMKRLADDIAGRSLARANALLAEIREFGNER